MLAGGQRHAHEEDDCTRAGRRVPKVAAGTEEEGQIARTEGQGGRFEGRVWRLRIVRVPYASRPRGLVGVACHAARTHPDASLLSA